MPRPRSPQPTPGELEILKLIWDHGPVTGREALELLNRDGEGRAYTSVTSLMNVMADKGLLRRVPEGRAFRYAACRPRCKTLAGLLSDLVARAFDGSPGALVAQLLDERKLSPEELDAIRRAIDAHDRR